MNDNRNLAGPIRNIQPAKSCEPDWAGGLKQLYDAVVDEPLPDAFKDLLAKLDENAKP